MQNISLGIELPRDANVLALYLRNIGMAPEIVSPPASVGDSTVSQAKLVQATVAAPVETPPTGPTLKELTAAFMAAGSKCKENGDDKLTAAFKALGCTKVKDVPLVAYAEVIAALNGVAKDEIPF